MNWPGLLAALLFSTAVPALEPQLARGLSVRAEKVGEGVVVDGLRLSMERFTGEDVLQLAERVEAAWRMQGSQIRALRQGEWTLRSRLLDTRSEVVQWRAAEGGGEMLWSSLDVRASLQPVPDAGLVLPAGCLWLRSAWGESTGHHYLQRSARCRQSRDQLAGQLQRAMEADGWVVRSKGRDGMLLDRAGVESLLSISTSTGDQATWLVWLRVEPMR